MTCAVCNAKLDKDDIGLTKKLVDRRAQEFLCIDCIAARYKVDRTLLERKIEEFKAGGCKFFE